MQSTLNVGSDALDIALSEQKHVKIGKVQTLTKTELNFSPIKTKTRNSKSKYCNARKFTNDVFPLMNVLLFYDDIYYPLKPGITYMLTTGRNFRRASPAHHESYV